MLAGIRAGLVGRWGWVLLTHWLAERVRFEWREEHPIRLRRGLW